jgi:hypothetical protein
MSAECMGWAMSQTTRDATDKLVLIALANQANDFDLSGRAVDGYFARARLRTIQRIAMCDEMRVFIALANMKHIGLVLSFEADAEGAYVSVELCGGRS